LGIVAENQSSNAIIKVKGITGSNHCFSNSSESRSRGDRLAYNRVPKLVPMVLADIKALPRRAAPAPGGATPAAWRESRSTCHFLSAAAGIGTGEVAAVFGMAKQLPPLALLLSSQTGCV
jgi:hypothetical protein